MTVFPDDLILFIGDSITDTGRADDPDDLGVGFVRMVADHLDRAMPVREVLNRGIGGDRAVDLDRRWQRDVLDHDPNVLTIYVGINDVARRFDADDETTSADFERTYRGLLGRIGSRTRTIVLIEPFLTPVDPPQQAWSEDLDGKRGVVRALASETGALLLPAHDLLSRLAAQEGPLAVAADGVHPTPLSHRALADAWLALIGIPRC